MEVTKKVETRFTEEERDAFDKVVTTLERFCKEMEYKHLIDDYNFCLALLTLGKLKNFMRKMDISTTTT